MGIVDEVRTRSNSILSILGKRAEKIDNDFVYDGIDRYPNWANPAVFWFVLSQGDYKCSYSGCKAQPIKNPIHVYL